MLRFLTALAHKNVLIALFISLALLLSAVGPFYIPSANAATLNARRLQISNSTPGASNVSYDVSFAIATPGTLGSIEIQICSNSPLLNEPCTPPTGFDASSAVLAAQSGATGFTISPLSNANNIVLTRAPAAVGTVSASYSFTQINNPSTAGPYYAKIFTYPTNDATGSYTDGGGLALSIQDGFPVSAEVPPYLIFCSGVTVAGFDCNTAQGNTINLGQLNPVSASTAQSQMVVATNAESGYVITVSGTTMTSGNNILPAMQTATSQPGASQFGLNLRANTNPPIGQDPQGPGTGGARPDYNLANRFTFNNGQQVAFGNGVQDYRKYTASYVVNTSSAQPPGVYATTLTYICLATF